MLRSTPCRACLLVAALLAATAPAGAAMAQAAPATTPAPVSGPQLVVASVKLNGGWRASKFIGSAVYDDQNHRIGSVDDLVLSAQDKAAVAILSVGGFLGIGNKLVAVDFTKLQYDPTSKDPKVVMPGATKDTLGALPSFTYEND